MLRSVFPSIGFALAALSLAACGSSGDGGTSTGGSTTTTTSTHGTGGSTTTTTTSTQSGTTTTSGTCATGKTITGMVSYSGTAGPNDTLRVAAVKDGMPGIPAGFNQYKAPTFPLAYEIDALPVDATAGSTNYGIIAYLDYGSDDFMGPGKDDPQYATPMTMLIKVTDCQGGTQDFTLPPQP